LKLGISATVSIFFHELPHEVGDFSYLLKQGVSKLKALSSQVVTAAGAFIGVYLSFLIGDKYSTEILAFSSGAFLYLSINTMLGDLKDSKSFISIIMEGLAFIAGVFALSVLI
jgi:zinc transporter ZupT